MHRKARPYIFLGQTTSMCESCLRLVPAKIIEQNGAVWYQKRCADHGVQKTLVSSESRYWKRCRDFLKPGDLPLQFRLASTRAVRTIAVCVPTTSSTAAWR